MGPTKGLVLVVGITFAFWCFAYPPAAIVMAIFSSTSLQVLGSSHLTGLPASFSKLFGAISLGAILLHLWAARWKLTSSPLYRPMLPFAAIVLYWDLMVRNPETGLMEGTLRLVMMLLMTTVIATTAGQSQRYFNIVVLGFLAALGLCGIVGLAEHFLPSLAIESDDPALAQGAIGAILDRESLDGTVIKRITGGIGDANWLSYTMAMGLPFVIYGWHRYTGLYARMALMMLALLMLIAMVLSYTRTGFLGIGVAFLYLLIRGVVPLKPMLFAMFVGFCAGIAYMPPGFVDRMFSSQYLKEGSTPLRMLFVNTATEIWAEKPVFGYGYKGFGTNFYERIMNRPIEDIRLLAWREDTRNSVIEGRELVSNIGAHNLQLELMVEYGLVGAFLYFAIFVAAWTACRDMEKRGPPHMRIFGICAFAALIAFLFCGLLGHAKYLKVLWIIFGLIMAAHRLVRQGDSGTRSLFEAKVTT